MDQDELIRQGKLRRVFRAKRKVVYPEFVSHITQRAAGREPLFVEELDYLCMLSNMKDIAKKRSLDIYAFCLMPNHIHLLLSPRADELHESMRDLFSRYGMMFNRKYERKGHLFAGPYRQAVCLDDAYLLAASLYIHMNPVRAGIVDDPLAYRWSSVNLYHDLNAPQAFIKPAFVLRLLGQTARRQKVVYSEMLKRAVLLEQEDVLERPNAISRFCTSLAKVFPEIFLKGRNNEKPIGKTGLDMLSDVEIEHKISQMRGKKARISPESRRARQFLIEHLISRGYKRDQIASMLGVSIKTVYNILKADISGD